MLTVVPEQLTVSTTLAEAVAELPQAANVFDRLGIDYSCRGARSIGEAATAAGLFPNELIDLLAQEPEDFERARWNDEPLGALMEFLRDDHQGTIGRIEMFREAVEEALEGQANGSELRRLRNLILDFTEIVSDHVRHEERTLFPGVDRIDSAARGAASAPTMRISQLVLREHVEHELLRERLRTMKELAAVVHPLPGGERISDRLQRVVRDVHYHMHLENNVLYPRAIAMENSFRKQP